MTVTRIRKGLSYVIGESTNNENHILPINSIQYSSLHKKMFTGGRDGVVKVWDSQVSSDAVVPSNGKSKDDDTRPTDMNETLLKLETCISSNVLSHNQLNTSFQVSENHNLHFDWINDMLLINNDDSLVTCSSDLSLKLVNLTPGVPKDSQIHKFANVHTDYVKKLSSCENSNNIISGGLDGKIVIWDLDRLAPVRTIDNDTPGSISRSIYSLSNDNANLISCGGPNNTINIFDKRLESPFIKKLIGHQENVRCMLMDNHYVLSGSSDCTIKLWDLRNYKICKSFDVHEDPIWCLTSTAPDFKTFYSADKVGNIVKTDMTHLNTMSNDFANNALIEKVGLSTLIAKCDTPVMSLCIESDENHNEISLFASTNMSLNRYYVPNTHDLSLYQYLRNYHEFDSHQSTDDLTNEANNDNDINSDFFDLVSHFSIETNLDIQSNFSTPNNISNAGDEVDTSEYASMFFNTSGGGPSMEFVNIDKNNARKPDEYINNIPVEILLNPINPDQITMIPFHKAPIKRYPFTPKSIIAKRLFNNKRSMLVLYLNGDISIWDIFICKKTKTFKFESSSPVEMTSELLKKRLKDMDNIFQEYQTTDTLNNWCEVEIKSGKLFVTLSETTFNNVEVYYDELIDTYPFLSIEYDEDSKKHSRVKITNDDRVQLSRILLNSMFHMYALYEWEFDQVMREELKKKNDIQSPPKEAFNRIKMFSRKSSSTITSMHIASNGNSRPSSNSNSTNVSVHELSLSTKDSVQEFIDSEDVDQYEDSINFLLHDNKAKYLETLTTSKSKVPKTALKFYSNDAKYSRSELSTEESIAYKPLIDLSHLPQDLLIIIFENSPSLGNLRDVFSFRLSELSHLKYAQEDSDQFVNHLRTYLPKWIGQPILYDRFPIKESPKIAFQLLELDYNTLPPEKKINGKAQRKIKRLPVLESSIKLTSHNMLRVSKILGYLTEKFESKTSEMKDKITPTEWLVLECRGQELLPSMTLQTIKSKIWKSSSDIELRFRRKFDK
ncbi:hypothetical protein PSN45_001704 [Yamadazyma tenuis]|uniref:WD40 repeat-like protein n=1 Tax=Candida tenuis (strain ATCC 10573 / BCRC 21748 / CBS 615 / JCM 9827 / NBRC 10315 / NRRL Y-1498 / VKM Y-70) TaxID=590646 RepID=G3BEF9_CANTC|nr:WD40 repeat-like protein [Yamadazyma tenuis ATCC 10573]XP_006689751.1 uncharacterized protein CANTEDRAFT_137016 [Yamadazyma tenuis ATCC 10573]EGV60536.1 WD40 repeat-like protein [Yamadazyma tenuis ATCC 10573]EGV60537.1 hypothetical protein CANTEDRAFT_137016 [Yamadazyma tenuis ATCC 10573]WEJ94223.1 hypothetical protein PSN45_001704 [Yamadazyma tenuis]